MERSELKAKSKAQLKGRWLLAIITLLVAGIITSIFSLIANYVESSVGAGICQLISLVLGSVMSVGICEFSLNMASDKEAAFADIFSGLNVFLKALGLYILIGIVVCIGFIIIIVPGIILALMFSQSFYILTENRDMSIIDCMKKSNEMMKGHKWEFFVLGLSFLGWAILAAIPAGLGYLWLVPYMNITYANYYRELKKSSEA